MADERVRSVVDGVMRQFDQEVRRVILEEKRLQDRVALVRVNGRDQEVRVLLAVLDAPEVLQRNRFTSPIGPEVGANAFGGVDPRGPFPTIRR